MLEAFRAVPPEFQTVREALFGDWRRLIVERTLQTAHGGPRVACGDWVPALVDAARVGPERGDPARRLADALGVEASGSPRASRRARASCAIRSSPT
jgi:hypothetical protein